MSGRTRRRSVLPLLLGIALILPTAAAADPGREPGETPPATSVVRLALDGRNTLDRVARNFDISGNVARVPSGFEVDAVVTDDEIAALEALGVTVKATAEAWSWADIEASSAEEGIVALADGEAAAGDTVYVGRVDYFTTKGQGFLSVEAKTTDGLMSSVQLRLYYDNGPGTPITPTARGR
jgi:hypothetical protein